VLPLPCRCLPHPSTRQTTTRTTNHHINRIKSTHAVVDVYASNKLAPSATYTLAARGAAGVGGSGSAAAAADKGRASFGHGRRRRKD
jgi:hypothetical protein